MDRKKDYNSQELMLNLSRFSKDTEICGTQRCTAITGQNAMTIRLPDVHTQYQSVSTLGSYFIDLKYAIA